MTEKPKPYVLDRDPRFRADDQREVARFLAQFADQSRRLEAEIANLDVDALAWTPGPGRNSVGMLLCHIALTEVFWMGVAARGVTTPEAAEALSLEIAGMSLNDDGMPAAAGSGPPAALAGWDVARYVALMRHAREFMVGETLRWTDADLGGLATYRGRELSREWTLYHLLEHFACHYGQICLVMALRRASGGA
ncbi:MAG: DinB family protein [Planctomycetes bacterium]|nr:DinB family protein [Planctomycetota bacterium]